MDPGTIKNNWAQCQNIVPYDGRTVTYVGSPNTIEAWPALWVKWPAYEFWLTSNSEAAKMRVIKN